MIAKQHIPSIIIYLYSIYIIYSVNRTSYALNTPILCYIIKMNVLQMKSSIKHVSWLLNILSFKACFQTIFLFDGFITVPTLTQTLV